MILVIIGWLTILGITLYLLFANFILMCAFAGRAFGWELLIPIGVFLFFLWLTYYTFPFKISIG